MPPDASDHDRLYENKLDRSGRDQLSRSFQISRGVARRNSTVLYAGMRRIPEPKRSAMFSIYAWKRRVDNAADLDGIVESRRVEVNRLREMTDRAFDGTPTRNADAFWDGFADTVHRYQIPKAWLDSLFEGLEWDLSCGVCETEQELEKYGYQVGSTIAMTLAKVCGPAAGVDEGDLLEQAKNRGLAFQLTNILRDFAADYDSYPKRQYLPREWFVEAGLKPNAMRAWMPSEDCERFALRWIDSAHRVFESSAGLESMLDPSCRAGVRLMTAHAVEILRELGRNPSRMVRGHKAGVSAVRRTRLAVVGRMVR
ncbi:MAG: phytoene synthase [Phycisphaerales bacterium]|jgi:phytoene synthase